MVELQKRKIRWAISLLLVMLYFSCLTAQAQYGGGSGEPNEPYLIYTAEQMNAIGLHEEDWYKDFKLMADIDLAAYTGTDFNIIGYYVKYSDNKPFTGVFDGNGHTISNFSYTSTDRDRVGLFGYVEGGTIKDLGLIDPNVDAGTGDRVGSLVGYGGGTINNCYAEGASVAGHDAVGGLMGSNWLGGTITNCYSTGSVTGNEQVGGLLGEKHETVTNCYAAAIVSGINNVGGLVGTVCCGTITNCSATGTVTGGNRVGGLVGNNTSYDIRGPMTTSGSYAYATVDGCDDVGGLVGLNNRTITDCYAFGDVAGTGWNVGGLVGNNSGTTTKCYSVGSVVGTQHVGGLVGYNEYGAVTDSFWDMQTSGQSTSSGGTGKMTAEMQDPNTFMEAGWDFAPHDIWAEPAGGGYPVLWWQLSTLLELPAFSGGAGEPDNPYLLSTADDLNRIGHNPRLMGAHFKLTNDIDLAGVDFFMIGNEQYPFGGVFDGYGHKILNFNYGPTGRYYVGLFGYVEGENAEIKDLGLIDPNIDVGTEWCVASLVGLLKKGTITNCYVEAGSVAGYNHVGGLVGYNSGTISDCYATGSFSGNECVGGLVGFNSGSIATSHSTGTVNGDISVGGLVGQNSGIITNCYSSASVSGLWASRGGLVGALNKGIIANCYSTGSVSSYWSWYGGVGGGLVGEKEYGAVYDSFWDIQTSGQTTSDGGTGLPTAEMQMASTFIDSGWDFVAETENGTDDIWSICEGTNYPRLVWQIPAGDFVCPDGVTIEDFVFFIEYWRDDNCDISNDYCDGTDLDFSGTVDEADLEILVENWLSGGND